MCVVLQAGWSSTLSTTQHKVLLLQAAPAPAAPGSVPTSPPIPPPLHAFQLQAQVSTTSLASSLVTLFVALLSAVALWANGTTNMWEKNGA